MKFSAADSEPFYVTFVVDDKNDLYGGRSSAPQHPAFTYASRSRMALRLSTSSAARTPT
jgi:hypothetical protein